MVDLAKQVVVILSFSVINPGSYAETAKAVDIPMGGDGPPAQFHIVPAETPAESNRGRLETTATHPGANQKPIGPSWTNLAGIPLYFSQIYYKDIVETRRSIQVDTGAQLDPKKVNCRNWTSSSSGDNYNIGALGFIGPWWAVASPAEREWRFVHDSVYCVQQ